MLIQEYKTPLKHILKNEIKFSGEVYVTHRDRAVLLGADSDKRTRVALSGFAVNINEKRVILTEEHFF